MAEIPYGVPASGATTTVSPATNANSTIIPPTNAKMGLCTVSVQNAYVTFDASTPTSTNGLTVVSGGMPFVIPGGVVSTWRAVTSGAIVNVCWFS